MDEQSWLASTDPGAMLAYLTGRSGKVNAPLRPSDRKLRLFACACLRDDNRDASYIEIAERFADGVDTEIDRRALVIDTYAYAVYQTTDPRNIGRDIDRRPKWAALLRDIFGNPFRPVAVCGVTEGLTRTEPVPDCENCRAILTPAIVAGARTIYDAGRFSADELAVLADQLEEAGCDAADLLQHLRGMERVPINRVAAGRRSLGLPEPDPRDKARLQSVWQSLRGPHCRGCWAIDLILGRE